jgi:hypothetical protein
MTLATRTPVNGNLVLTGSGNPIHSDNWNGITDI